MGSFGSKGNTKVTLPRMFRRRFGPAEIRKVQPERCFAFRAGSTLSKSGPDVQARTAKQAKSNIARGWPGLDWKASGKQGFAHSPSTSITLALGPDRPVRVRR